MTPWFIGLKQYEKKVVIFPINNKIPTVIGLVIKTSMFNDDTFIVNHTNRVAIHTPQEIEKDIAIGL